MSQRILLIAILSAMIGCNGNNDSTNNATTPDMANFDAGGMTADAGHVDDLGGSVDAGGADLGAQAVLAPATFSTSAKFGVTNLPARADATSPLLEDDLVDSLRVMIGSPPRFLKLGVDSNGALNSFAGVTAQTLDAALVSAGIEALTEQAPLIAARRTTASDDFRTLMEGTALSSTKLLGTLEVVSAPDASGGLATEQQYEFTEIAFTWRLRCADSPTLDCDEPHSLALSELIPPMAGVFGGEMVDGELKMAPHPMSFSVIGFARAFVTKFALPQLTNEDAPFGERDLAEFMMGVLIDSYNATPAGQAEPASKSPDLCAGVALSWSRLAATQDATIDAAALEPLLRTGCEDALAFADAQATYMAEQAQAQAVLTTSTDYCVFRDAQDDGVFDEFGALFDPTVDSMPHFGDECFLNVEMETIDGSPLVFAIEFEGTKL